MARGKRSNKNRMKVATLDRKQKFIDELETTRRTIAESAFYKHSLEVIKKEWEILKKQFLENQQKDTPKHEIVYNAWLLGIGNITLSLSSSLQIVFMELICNELGIANVSVYDPIILEEEKSILTEIFKFEVSNEDTNCNYSVDSPTLFYIPHGEKFMYCNLIASNEKNLFNLLIIGNSFASYDSRAISAHQRTELKCIFEITSTTIESPLSEYDDRSINAFTDTSVHRFTI